MPNLAPPEQIEYQLAIERLRYQQQLAEQAKLAATENQPPKLGWGVFLLALFLTIIQLGVTWLTGDTLGLILTIPISIGLFFMLRPYRKSMGETAWFANIIALVFDGLFDFIPFDILTLIWAFLASRNQTLQKLAHTASPKR